MYRWAWRGANGANVERRQTGEAKRASSGLGGARARAGGLLDLGGLLRNAIRHARHDKRRRTFGAAFLVAATAFFAAGLVAFLVAAAVG